jgi:hypothetical protein
MAMNPDNNTMEPLKEIADMFKDRADADYKEAMLAGRPETPIAGLVRPNGEPVPEHWSTYSTGEEVIVKSYRWRVAHIGEKHLLLEPVGPVLVGEVKP